MASPPAQTYSPYRDELHPTDPMASARTSMDSISGGAGYKHASSLLPADSRGVYLSPLAAVSAASVSSGEQRRRSAIAEAQQGSSWLEKQKKGTKRSSWVLASICTVILLVIGGGIALGVVFGTKANQFNSTGTIAGAATPTSSSSTNNTAVQPAGVVQSDPKDPSVFTKDSKLHQSFYGMAYTPKGAIYPDCAPSLPDVIEDMQLLSQLTTRIRLYGADCNQTAIVLEAIKQTKVKMQVYVAIFVVDGDDTAYTRQKAAIESALTTYGADNIAGITVGNEFMLNYLAAHNGADPNDAVGRQGSALLVTKIRDVRTMLAGMTLSKTIPVGNSDAGSYFSTTVLQSIDYGLSNIHAWFASVTAAQASKWTLDFFQETNVAPAALLTNAPEMYIAETGWPTKSSDAKNAQNGANSAASIANLQVFLDTFVCQANTLGTKYFFFEFFDEEWKEKAFGGVEPWWGLFNADKTLKAVTLPICASP